MRTYARRLVALGLLTALLASPAAHAAQEAREAEKASPFRQGKDQQIQQIKPRPPVRIKLHRTAKGEYQWDITGGSAEEVVRADQRLRKLLNLE